MEGVFLDGSYIKAHRYCSSTASGQDEAIKKGMGGKYEQAPFTGRYIWTSNYYPNSVKYIL
ncbi:hypothetical protein Q5Y71_16755, partial [Microbulbifer sp. 2205BS26-8]|nr:hypothetical protein [Microbulbifer sp. 2205BS26-8]